MKHPRRVVLDSNALISGLSLPGSIPALALRRVVSACQLLVSAAVMGELAEVLAHAKFDRYISIEDRQEFLRMVGRIGEMVPITFTVRACRDPKDDKFLELALNGSADLIISRDKDLLALSPFRHIPILTPAAFLKEEWPIEASGDRQSPIANRKSQMLCTTTTSTPRWKN